MDCGFTPRCALEAMNSAQVRIEKIFAMIEESNLGVHDISRTGLDPLTDLPRFNMPLELGIFLAAKRFGGTSQRNKSCLIFDSEPFRYQRFISDIAGQDIAAHQNQPATLIERLRDWLAYHTSEPILPGGEAICVRFDRFRADMPAMRAHLKLNQSTVIFRDLVYLIRVWLEDNCH